MTLSMTCGAASRMPSPPEFCCCDSLMLGAYSGHQTRRSASDLLAPVRHSVQLLDAAHAAVGELGEERLLCREGRGGSNDERHVPRTRHSTVYLEGMKHVEVSRWLELLV